MSRLGALLPSFQAFSIAALAAISIPAFAGTIHVNSASGDDATGDGSPEAPFKTVEKGVAEAVDGDTVLLADGNYPVAAEWLYVTNAITLASANGPDSTSIYSTRPNSKRNVVWMSNEDAVLSGIKIKDGNYSQYHDGSGAHPSYPGGLYLNGGTVTNCVFTNNRGGNASGGALHLVKGLVTHCVFDGNKSTQDSNTSQGIGGAMRIDGGVAEYCVFSNNYALNSYDQAGCGGAIYAAGGIVRHSIITQNKCKDQNGREGAGISLAGGLVEFCEITDNGSGGVYAGPGAGVKLYAGTLRNCFIGRNVANGNGAAVYQLGGTMEYCTIAGNVSSTGAAGGLFLNGSKAVCRNNVIFGNGDPSKKPEANVKYASGTYEYNSSDREVVANAGNVGNPRFTSPESGDYSLAAGSPAIDAALHGEQVPATDLAGNARPKDGDGDGNAVADMGCYEAPSTDEGTLRCSFSVSGTDALNSCLSSFSASVAGAGASGEIVYKWDIGNDGTFDIAGADKATFSTNITEYGKYDVLLRVEAGESFAEYLVQNAVRIGAAKIYVNADNAENASWPYATPETAAADIYEAFDTIIIVEGVQNEIVIADGTYPVNGMYMNIKTPMYIHGTSTPDRTILNANGTSGKRRVFHISHPDAVVENLTMANGNWDSYYNGDSGPGAVRVTAGLLRNCILRDNLGGDAAGAAQITGGRMTDCLIYNNRAYRGSNSSVGTGGGFALSGGVVDNCVVTNNLGGSAGGNAYITGGVVSNCLFEAGYCNYNTRDGGNVYITGGRMERCEIRNAKPAKVGNGGGVYQTGGTVVNCFIHHNTTAASAGGVYQKGGTMEFCTIVGNGCLSSGTANGLVLNGANAVFRNNIVHDNGDVSQNEFANVKYSAGRYEYNLSDSEVVPGANNVANASPGFTDAQNGDYTLTASSPAVDAADPASILDIDFSGNSRPKDGDGDGTALNDMGCFEAKSADEGEFRCDFTPTTASGFNTATVEFTANAAGAGSKGECTYQWSFDGDYEVTAGSLNSSTVTVKFLAPGAYAVRLTAVNAAGDSAFASLDSVVRVGSDVAYVNTTGSGIWPYSTPETGTNDICEVFASMIRLEGITNTVYVGEGTFTVREKWIDLNKPTRLLGTAGREKCILKAGNSNENNMRILNIANAGVLVSGLTLTGARLHGYVETPDQNGGAAVTLTAGTVTDCVIRDSHASVECTGGIVVKGGKLTDSVITGCKSDIGGSSWSKAYGGGVRVISGLVENCVITNNIIDKYIADDNSFGGGVYVNGANAVVRHCYIADNRVIQTRWSNYRGSQVKVTAGLLENCEIGHMSRTDIDGVPVYLTGGTIRNCLIAGANSKAAVQAVEVAGGDFYNNTVVTNGFEQGISGAVAAKISGGAIANCIFANNKSDAVDIAGGTVTYSRFADSTGTGNISEAPLFKAPESGNWSILPASPCKDSGDTAPWGGRKAARESKDLAGNSRYFGVGVDMGCYELMFAPFRLILR